MREVACFPYGERNGVNAPAEVEILLAEPEIHLDGVEKEAAYKFAHGLYNGIVELPNGSVIAAYAEQKTAKSLGEINASKASDQAKTFYLGYFETEKGRADLKNLGITDVVNHEDISRCLSDVEALGTKDLKKRQQLSSMARESHAWYIKDLEESLAKDASEDSNYRGDASVTINLHPDKLLAKLDDLQTYRRFYRSVRRQLAEEPTSSLLSAKQALLDIYFKRVNGAMALMYPNALDLSRQLARTPQSEVSTRWRQQLQDVMPFVRLAFAYDKTEEQFANRQQSFTRRLDLLRNGAANRGEPNFSPISEQLEQLAQEYESPKDTPETTVIPSEIIEQLLATPATADKIQKLLEALLDEWNLLSEHTATWEEVEESTGPAPDGKWQVVQVPRSGKLDVAESKKIMQVGAEQQRNQADALKVAAHEPTHVLQAEYGDKLAETIPLAAIKGRGALTTWEMGGIYQERRFNAMLGLARPTNFTYFRALEAKLQGANRAQAARVSYEESVSGREQDEAGAEKQRHSAADRVERIYRYGGNNSQPLDYSEQELLLRALEHLPTEQVSAIAIAGGAFAFDDAARLHTVDLLQLPQEVDKDPAADIMRIFREKFMDAWLTDK